MAGKIDLNSFGKLDCLQMTDVMESHVGIGWKLVLILLLTAIRGKQTFRSESLFASHCLKESRYVHTKMLCSARAVPKRSKCLRAGTVEVSAIQYRESP